MKKINGVLTNVTQKDIELLEKNPEKFWKGVTKIGPGAFEGVNIKNITIPEGVLEIGDIAFKACSVKSISLPKSLKTIGASAFYLSLLTEIDIPESVTEIGAGAFDFCERLVKANIKANITEIKTEMFKACHSLKEVVLPQTVTKIASSAFSNTPDLHKITLPSGLEYIGARAFEKSGITSIDIPNSCKYLGDRVFASSYLFSANISKNITTIPQECFFGCQNLNSIEIPENVKELEKSTFENCTGLTDVKLPENLEKIGESVFEGCNTLQQISLPLNLKVIDEFAFNYCNSLKSIEIPKNVKSLKEGSFRCCTSLTDVKLPENLEKIGESVFEDCNTLQQISLPLNLKVIDEYAFNYCSSLESIEIPKNIKLLKDGTFFKCTSLTDVKLPENLKKIEGQCFDYCKRLRELIIPDGVEEVEESFVELTYAEVPLSVKSLNFMTDMKDVKYIYLKRDGTTIFTNQQEEQLEENSIRFDYSKNTLSFLNSNNTRKNLIKIDKLKQEGKLKFTPPNFMIQNFPSDCFDNFLINNNHGRWGRLVKQLKFDTLKDQEKENSLTDLFKIYYAIGGFSSSLAEREKAYKYIIDHVAVIKGNPDATPEEVGEKIHRHFSKLELTGEFNPIFAQFFMKYYKDNSEFMWFVLEDEDGYNRPYQDYLCQAHNNFNAILKNYPNRVVNGNEERALLTPLFVAEHSSFVEYDDVDEGNEELANLVGKYGYSQDQFDEIQEIYNKAKTIKDKYVICADKANEKDCVTYRVLEKDDPLGFVLGDITNCCQHIGGAGEKCVDDGYTNPDAGFLVFEESIKDEKGNFTGEKRILAQAYVWYDPVTKTVCYDNIEIPTKVLDELRKGEKHDKELSASKLLKAVEDSAESIIKAMNAKGIEVKRVTTGKGYNDLNKELSDKFKLEGKPKAKHRSYSGYSDARSGQYIIKEYDDVTKLLKTQIETTVESAKEDIKEIENKGFKYKFKKILKAIGLLKNDNKDLNQDEQRE